MKKGFTLIELLVVISIIGILAAMATISYTSAQKQARDTNRKSDLTQYRSSLETYANKNNGLYPSYPSRISPYPTLCAPLGLGSTCPEDPKNSVDDTYYYSYISDGSGAGASTATQYVLWAKLESISPTTYWVVCSNGKSGKVTLIPTTGVCPI